MKKIKYLLSMLTTSGHEHYTSRRTKEELAKQFLSISEKIFLGILIPLFGYMLEPTKVNIGLLIFATVTCIIAGMFLQRQGLKIIDSLEIANQKNN